MLAAQLHESIMPHKLRSLAETLSLALSGLVVALALGWMLLALVNFSYGFWHDHGGIEEAIESYGGLNRYRSAFEQTSREQRVALFSGINVAIHRDGEGLEALTYEVPGYPVQQLLREPEILHLQDVARLVTLGSYISGAMLLVWLCSWVYLVRFRRPVPTLKRQMAVTLGLIVTLGALVLIIGPVDVFYALHEWIFPPDHPWFFYYQDSLMSTMMYAPVLFGYIAVEWLALAVLLFVGLQLLGAKASARLAQRVG